MTKPLLVLAMGLITCTAAAAQQDLVAYNKAVDDYFDQVYFKYAPTSGTLAGLHEYDTKLETFRRADLEAEAAALHSFEQRFAAIPQPKDDLDAGDYELVTANIHAQLLALETIRMWEKNPDVYSSACAQAAFAIMERKFDTRDDRLRRLTAREQQMPKIFDDARANLKNPPKVYTEIALEQLPGIISFFQDDVPAAFKDAKDKQRIADFRKSNAAVIAALKQYEDWVKSDVLPRSNGDFRIGAKVYAEKLKYDEMVDIPLDRLLDIGYADLKKNQQAFTDLAKQIDPTKTPQEVLAELVTMHPENGQVLQAFQSTFDGLIQFIHEHGIVTIPSDVRPTLEATPPFMRATTFASMDTPGPYEAVATEAYFNVTIPVPGMSPQEVKDTLEGFNFGTITSTSIHEAYPGHYVQFLWVKQAPTKVRKLLGAASNAEGWAHYCEQMMLDEGYGRPGLGAKDEREAKFIRLGQLQDALLRNARFIVGIKMHTGQMTMEQAQDFFVKEGFQTHGTAVVETKRGTSDPTYLYYTLGKLQILKLRADMQKKLGPHFNLEQFHDEFLKQGTPPLRIVRKAMLGDDSPTL